MTVNKRKKAPRYRAHSTHGWGSRKKRRGAGNRGGRGRAGSGKRNKGKKQSFPPLGRRGFLPRGSRTRRKNKEISTLNLNQLQTLIQDQKITEKDGLIDLTSFGCQKLLGTGKISLKLKIKVNQLSEQAEEKIKAAGGSVIPEKRNKEKGIKEKEIKEETSEE